MKAPSDLIPHRPPWVLLDRVRATGEAEVVAEKVVSADDPWVVAGELPGLLVTELAAQAAACMMGQRGDAGHRGYLVAARGWKFPTAARSGDRLVIAVTRVSELGALRGFRCRAQVDEREVASGELTCAVHFDSPAAVG